jgi:protein disulfide-isomerase A1
MRRSERPVVSTLDKDSLTAFKSIDDAVFIGHFGSGHAQLKSSFTTLASRNHNKFSFGIVSNAALAQANDIPLGCITCYKSQGEQETLCDQSRLDVLQDFVERSTAPLIGEMTRRNELKYLQVRRPIWLTCEDS